MATGNVMVGIAIAAGVLWGCALGAYLGIARARAPFGAPESEDVVQRRLRFKAEHIHRAKLVLAVVSVIAIAAILAATLTNV